jgi:hypothetical protein
MQSFISDHPIIGRTVKHVEHSNMVFVRFNHFDWLVEHITPTDTINIQNNVWNVVKHLIFKLLNMVNVW